MTEEAFEKLQNASGGFAYTSLKYANYEDLQDFAVIESSDALLLLHGFNKESKLWEYQWAADDKDVLLGRMDLRPDTMIPFVPAEWLAAFHARGIADYSCWHDYFIHNLASVDTLDGGMEMRADECARVVAVTQACRYQSRGFSGQTEEFVRQWISDTSDPDMLHKTVFIEKQGDEIVGAVFTCTYAQRHPKGAVAWIREAAVAPRFQNRGIGRRLILQALGSGKRHGAKRAFLAADELNTGAVALYTSIGFTPGEDAPQNDMIVPDEGK